jgi:hypothetical protein
MMSVYAPHEAVTVKQQLRKILVEIAPRVR